MAVYTTGVTRTLEFEGTLSGPISFGYSCVGSPGATALTSYQKALFGIEWMSWVQIYNDWTTGGALPLDCTPTAANATYSLNASIAIGGGEAGDNPTDSATNVTGYTRPGSVSDTIDGTFLIAADVEECFEILPLDGSLLNGDGWPIYGGPAADDGPPAYRKRYFERLKVGGQITASCTSGGCSVSVNVEITAGMQAEVGYALDFSDVTAAHTGGIVGSSMQVFGTSGTLAITCDVTGYTLSGNYNRSGGSASCSADAGLSLYATDPAYPAAEGSYATATIWFIHAPRDGALAIRTRSDVGAFPGAQTYRWLKKANGVLDVEVDVVASPDAAETVRQEAYHLRVDLNGTNQDDYEVSEQRSCRIYMLDPGATGDDDRDWRCCWQTVPFVAMTAQHASQAVIDDGSSTSGWTGAGVSVASVGGAVQLTGTGAPGQATRTYASPGTDAEAYRDLRVRIRSVGSSAEALTVAIGSKTWPVETGADGVYAEIDLDLCCPGNASASEDDTYTRWPLDADDAPSADGPLWGVSRIETLVVSGIGSGVVIEIDSLALVRNSWALISALPGFEHHEDDHLAAPVQIYPHAYLDVDGRLTDPGWYMSYDGLVWTHMSLEFVADLLNALQGLTCTASAAAGDGWHNADAPAAYLLGGGNYYQGGAWRAGLDVPVTGSTNLWAQGLYDEIEWYSGIGDPFEGAAHPRASLAMPLRINKIIRAAAQGLGFETDQEPAVGVTVEAFEAAIPGNAAGSDTTGALGEYLTGTPWGKGNLAHTTRFVLGGKPSVTATWQNRRRMRANFRAATDSALHECRDAHGRHYVAITNESGIQCWRFDAFGLDEILPVLASKVVESAQIAWNPSGYVQIVYATAEDGDEQVLRIVSGSWAESWSSPVSIGAGTHPAYAIDALTGYEFVALHDGSEWRFFRKTQEGGSFTNIAAIATIGANNAGLEVSSDAYHRLVFVVSDGANARRFTSTNQGETWTEE